MGKMITVETDRWHLWFIANALSDEDLRLRVSRETSNKSMRYEMTEEKAKEAVERLNHTLALYKKEVRGELRKTLSRHTREMKECVTMLDDKLGKGREIG